MNKKFIEDLRKENINQDILIAKYERKFRDIIYICDCNSYGNILNKISKIKEIAKSVAED